MPENNKFYSRKFLVTVGVVILSFVLSLLGRLDANWATVAAAAIAAYNLSNAYVTGKFAENGGGREWRE